VDHFNSLITTGRDLTILDLMLLQYFYMGLSKGFFCSPLIQPLVGDA
jgi:hypothetical protein